MFKTQKELYWKIKKWCVIQHGILSEFLIWVGDVDKVTLSHHLFSFLLCAEIMVLMIRNSVSIERISVNDKEYKLLQYADDTVLLLKVPRIYFNWHFLWLMNMQNIPG